MKLLLTLLLITNLFASQNEFSIIVDKPFHDSLMDVVADFDRGITAVGFSSNFQPEKSLQESYNDPFEYLRSVANSAALSMHVLKVSEYGAVIENKTIPIQECAKAPSLIKRANGGYTLGGETGDGSLMLLTLDSKLRILQSQRFGMKNRDQLNRVVPLRDGGLLVVATVHASRDKEDPLFVMGLGLADMHLSRYDKDGKLIWSQKYGTEHDDQGIDALEAKDGTLLLLSTTHNAQQRVTSLMRLSERGTKIWTHDLNSTQPALAYKIIPLRNGTFLLTLSEQNEMQKYQVRLVKFDLQKNILQDSTIYTHYPTILKDIAEYSDGKIVGVGEVIDLHNSDGIAMLFDVGLELLTQEHYGDENYDTFEALEILHDGKVAVVGRTTEPSSQESNMWLLKLNADLSLAKKTNSSASLYAQLNKQFSEEITKGVLSIKEDLTITFKADSLLFKQSQYILNKEQKDFVQSFAHKLLPILERYREKIEALSINGHTSSEWAKLEFNESYLPNLELSQKRAHAIIKELYQNQAPDTQKWLIEVLKATGYSFAKRSFQMGIENKEDSRRVSFKIELRDF